jgi:hypothetical protein
MKLAAHCRSIAVEWSPVQAGLSDASRDKSDIYCIKIAEKWLEIRYLSSAAICVP